MIIMNHVIFNPSRNIPETNKIMITLQSDASFKMKENSINRFKISVTTTSDREKMPSYDGKAITDGTLWGNVFLRAKANNFMQTVFTPLQNHRPIPNWKQNTEKIMLPRQKIFNAIKPMHVVGGNFQQPNQATTPPNQIIRQNLKITSNGENLGRNLFKGVPLVGNTVFMVFEGKYLGNYAL